MANTIVELLSPAGLTLTLELFPEGSDTIANGAGDTLTEATNRDGLYTATVTEALAGYYYAKIIDGSSNLISAGWVKLADDTNTYTVGERVVAIEGTNRQFDDLNDVAATDIVSAGAITTSGGAVSNVTTVATTTTNTDMRGTDSAFLSASAPANFGDLAITVTTGQVTVGTNADKTGYSISGTKTTFDALNDVSSADVNAQCDTAISDAALATAAALATVDTNVDSILVDTGTTIPASITALNDISVADILTTQMTESYATDGAAPTLAQAQFAVQQFLQETNVSGTTLTVKKLDGSTTAMTFTLDDATNPTSLTRAT